jgi:hypothetical protein
MTAPTPKDSPALGRWLTDSRLELDRLRNAYATVARAKRADRYTLEQLKRVYMIAVSAKFQRFCRDLHSDVVEVLAKGHPIPAFRQVITANLTYRRALDVGNPTPGTIGADFGRLVPRFWRELKVDGGHGAPLGAALQDPNGWRNAVAHDDFTSTKGPLRPPKLCIRTVDAWRRACTGLARSMNDLLFCHLRNLAGTDPW